MEHWEFDGDIYEVVSLYSVADDAWTYELTDPHRRLEYAEAIQRIVAEVDQGGPQMLPGPQIVRRDVITANRALLRVLAERMRTDHPLALRGLARVGLLIGDGASPLYRGLSPFQLRSNLLEALAALDPYSS